MSPPDIITAVIMQLAINNIVYISIVDHAIVTLMHARRSARTALMTDHLAQISTIRLSCRPLALSELFLRVFGLAEDYLEMSRQTLLVITYCWSY